MASECLLTLRQGQHMALEFWTLDMVSAWYSPALITAFCQGLRKDVVIELTFTDFILLLDTIIGPLQYIWITACLKKNVCPIQTSVPINKETWISMSQNTKS